MEQNSRSQRITTNKKCCIMLYGGVSTKEGPFRDTRWSSKDQLKTLSSSNINSYVDISICKKTLEYYIINENKDWVFDYFITSWCIPLKDKLNNLFLPKNTLYLNYEDYHPYLINTPTNTPAISVLSRLFIIKQAIQFLEKEPTFLDYSCFMFIRPDVFFYKPSINLNKLTDKFLYTDGPNNPDVHANLHHDTFFITLKKEHLLIYKQMFDHFYNDVCLRGVHDSLQSEYINKTTTVNGFDTQLTFDLIRRLPTNQHVLGDINFLSKLGINLEDFKTYTPGEGLKNYLQNEN